MPIRFTDSTRAAFHRPAAFRRRADHGPHPAWLERGGKADLAPQGPPGATEARTIPKALMIPAACSGGACPYGSTAPRLPATGQACGGAALTSTTRR